MPLNLATKVSDLGIIGRRLAKRLKNLDIETVHDLIFYFPARHEDLSKITPIKDLRADETANIRARIELIKVRRSPVKRKILTEAIVDDGTGKLKIIWFNQSYLGKILRPGDEYYFSGRLAENGASAELIAPEYEKVKTEQTHLARIVPIYPLTEGVSQKQLRYLIKESLPAISQIYDYLPSEIINQFELMPLGPSLNEIHFPETNAILNRAVTRAKFDELFITQLLNKKIRYDLEKESSLPVNFNAGLTKKFVDALPFKLTDGQRKAAWTILRDLGQAHPMNRLLNGDVGSGKTVVAAIAALNVALGNAQVAFMAPTEILAEQHFRGFAELFEEFSITIGLLTGGESKILSRGREENLPRKKILKRIGAGEIQIVLGTHALIEKKVIFKRLALAIVDEQHRFGVEQRKTLRARIAEEDKMMPHLLSMTATPIPRTLSLALYGDLDVSFLEEAPKNRKPIITKIVPPEKRSLAYQFIAKQIDAGRQVFVLCPLIDISDKTGAKSAKDEFEKLQRIFSARGGSASGGGKYRVGLLHGKMNSRGKNKTMALMKAGKIDILVATSVIEVGIDIPNATVMMIEGAERFGLAQLHQFRGRVGRGEHQSFCLIFTESKNEKTAERLRAMLSAKNGFELAEMDLKIRGPGEIYGTSQSGFADFKIATLYDYAIMKQAAEATELILERDSGLESFPLLKQKIDEHRSSIHFE